MELFHYTVERRLTGQLGTGRLPVNRFARIMVQEMSNAYKTYEIY